MESKVDFQAEEKKLRELGHKLREVERNKDLDATMSFYTEDSVLLSPGAPPIEGLEAIRNFLTEELFQIPMEDFDYGQSKIVISASVDMAYDIGWYRMPFDSPQGRVVEEGKYTMIWQKIEGEWKYMVGCWNSNKPA